MLVDLVDRDEQARLFPALTLPVYEQWLGRAAATLHLDHLGVTPHVVRHSAASHGRFDGFAPWRTSAAEATGQ